MTAPSPVPGAFLDRLEEARQAATPGPWDQDVYEVHAQRRRLVAETGWRPDAALIVAAVNNLPELLRLAREGQALRDKLLALHRPWYEINGVRHDNTVTVGCGDYDGCEGTSDRWCGQSDDEGHEVLACFECRCVVDYDIDGYLLWPCPTARLVADTTGEA